MRTVPGLENQPYAIAFNSHQEMIVSERQGHRLSIRGQKIRKFASHGDSPDRMMCPAGIATDDTDNIYVSSNHKLQKFTSSGELIKCIRQRGSEEGEFNDPRGITLYDNQLKTCFQICDKFYLVAVSRPFQGKVVRSSSVKPQGRCHHSPLRQGI